MFTITCSCHVIKIGFLESNVLVNREFKISMQKSAYHLQTILVFNTFKRINYTRYGHHINYFVVQLIQIKRNYTNWHFHFSLKLYHIAVKRWIVVKMSLATSCLFQLSLHRFGNTGTVKPVLRGHLWDKKKSGLLRQMTS